MRDTQLKVIVLRESDGGARAIRLGPALLLSTMLTFAGLVTAVAWLASGPAAAAPEHELLEQWAVEMQNQRVALDELAASAERQSAALGQRVAQMQARVLRMEALGEHVTKVANISSDEFSFGQPVALGGPESSTETIADFAGFENTLTEMTLALERQERQLRVLETVLADDQFNDAAAVKGRPVEWG